MNTCENCEKSHDGTYGSGRFCSTKCSRGFSTKAKRKEINEKVSSKLMNHVVTDDTRKKLSENNGKYWKGKKRTGLKSKNTSSIYKGVKREKKCKNCGTLSNILIFGSICDSCKGLYRVYKESCAFRFNVFDYPEFFDLSLIEKYGFYSAKNTKNPNLNGISRDHKISINYGFKNNIDPEIISHPLNCELMKHTDNQKKRTKCSINVKDLIDKIRSYRQMVSR